MPRKNKTVTLQLGNPMLFLFLLFLVLKLTGVVDWSWWGVTAPLWLPIVFVLVCFGIAIAVTVLVLFGAAVAALFSL